MKKVLVSSCLPHEGFSELSQHFDLTFPKTAIFSPEEAIKILPQFDALIPTFQFKVTQEIIDAGKNLKIIANYGVGYNNINVDYATKKGIVVTNTPDPVVEPTAEQAMALMLAVARRIAECDRKLRIPDGLKWGVMENIGVSLYGKTLGIIGMGNIGKALAKRAYASGMQLIYHNRTPLSPEEEKRLNASYCSLAELLSTADFISIHTPLTDDTLHLLDEDEFNLMKHGCIVINTARGPVINEKILIKYLENGKLYGAGLDVYEFEPMLSEQLLTMDNVVLAPHNGTATIDARNAMSRFASTNVIKFFRGDTDISHVNKEVWNNK
jgi:D-3-phosphoglycerate dehydrogenase